MAYSYGTAANPDALLEALKDFLLANGWTINRWDDIDHYYGTLRAEFSALGKQLCVTKTNSDGESMFFNFRSCNRVYAIGNFSTGSSYGGPIYYEGETTGIAGNASTGYDAGLRWDIQPGFISTSSGVSYGSCITGIFSSCNYWFVQNGDTVIIIAEVDADMFVTMAFGTLQKQGSIPDSAMFISASHGSYAPQTDFYYKRNRTFGIGSISDTPNPQASGAMYVSGIDGHTEWLPVNYNARGSSSGGGVTEYFMGMLSSPSKTSNQGLLLEFILQGSPNNFSQITPMWPIYQLMKRSGTSVYSMFGVPEGVRAINMSALNSKAEIIIGTDTWKVFPLVSKTGINYTPGVPGIAVLIS